MQGRHYLAALAAPEPPVLCEQVSVVDCESGDVLATVALRFGMNYNEGQSLLSAITEVASRDLGVTPAAIRNLLRVEASPHAAVFGHPCDPVTAAEPVWREVRHYFVVDKPRAA